MEEVAAQRSELVRMPGAGMLMGRLARRRIVRFRRNGERYRHRLPLMAGFCYTAVAKQGNATDIVRV